MRDIPLPTLPLSDLPARAPSRRSLHPGSHTALDSGVEPGRGAVRYEVLRTRDEGDVRQAQRLRHLVFAEEMGARLSVPLGTPAGHDVDMFDTNCEHLLVRARSQGDEPGP